MKRELTLALCAGAVLLALRAPAQDPPPDEQKNDLEARVESLEKALAVTIQQVDALSDELAEAAALMDQTVSYLRVQARSAEEMSSTLDLAEAEGFTFGINPRSREVLLAGWRQTLADARAGVPGAKAEAEAGEGNPPAKQQRSAGGAR